MTLAVKEFTPERGNAQRKLVLLSKSGKGQVLLVNIGQGRKGGLLF